MGDSIHLVAKSSDNQMPPDALHSPESHEQWISSDYQDSHNPKSPDPVMAAATPLPAAVRSSPDCIAHFLSDHQLSSSELSFEDVEDAPSWRNCHRKEAGMGAIHFTAESMQDFERRSRGKESENAPSTAEISPRLLDSKTEVSPEILRRLRDCKSENEPGTGSSANLGARSCSRESESTQKYETQSGNDTTNVVESFNENLTSVDNQNFFTQRSEREIDADVSETGTGLDASAETEPCFDRRDCETRSRFQACAEPETGFEKTGETESSFGVNETDFGKCITKPVFDSEKDSSRKTTTPPSKFDASAIETVTHELLQRTLAGVNYDPQRCRILSHDLAGKILATIIELIPKRYKLVIFVSIGNLADNPGIQFGSRCLWNADTDELATVRYANESLFAVVMVYGLYRE